MCTTSKQVAASLAGSRYRITSYHSQGQERYGLVKVSSLQGDQNKDTITPSGYSAVYNPITSSTNLGKVSGWRNWLESILFSLLISTLLALIVAYYQDGADDSLNRFFNSNSFGPRFVFNWSCKLGRFSLEAFRAR